MQNQERELPFAVMAAIYSPTYLLLIQNILDPELRWKFIGESNKENEEPLDVLARGVWEEGALMLRVLRDEFGHIIELGDSTMVCALVGKPVPIIGRSLHTQYFYKLRTTDARLLDLSGKRFPGGDPDEFFETRAFPVMDIPFVPDFFRPHRRLYNEFRVSGGLEPVATFAR